MQTDYNIEPTQNYNQLTKDFVKKNSFFFYWSDDS